MRRLAELAAATVVPQPMMMGPAPLDPPPMTGVGLDARGPTYFCFSSGAGDYNVTGFTPHTWNDYPRSWEGSVAGAATNCGLSTVVQKGVCTTLALPGTQGPYCPFDDSLFFDDSTGDVVDLMTIKYGSGADPAQVNCLVQQFVGPGGLCAPGGGPGGPPHIPGPCCPKDCCCCCCESKKDSAEAPATPPSTTASASSTVTPAESSRIGNAKSPLLPMSLFAIKPGSVERSAALRGTESKAGAHDEALRVKLKRS